MLEVALRANGATAATGPTVMVMDSRPRLEVADAMLKALIDCKFLIDQEEEYNQPDSKLGNDELRLTERSVLRARTARSSSARPSRGRR